MRHPFVLILVLLSTPIVPVEGSGEPVVILPRDGIAGSVVVIAHAGTQFADAGRISVRFGRTPARVTRIVDAHRFEVRVPEVPRGEIPVSVRYNGADVGGASFTVLPPTGRRVALEITGDDIELITVQPYGGRFDPPATDGVRLSYDVLDVDGELFYTSAIPHPAHRRVETFHDPAPHRVSRRPVSGTQLFVIEVPYLDSKTVVVFYEVKPGVDLSDPAQREERRRVAEIVF